MSAWKTVSLGDIAESVDYGVTASAMLQPVGPKFLRITDIQDGAVYWDNVPWCECNARSSANSRLKSGDIVFARTGATTGKSFLIRECPTDTVFASYLIRVRVSTRVEPGYLSHFFQTPHYWAQITKSARGVAQPGVNATTLKTLKIPLPPLPEQQWIANVLDRAEGLRAKRRASLTLLDTLTQAIFIDMFGNPATNTKEWPRKSLKALGKVTTGGTPPSSMDGMFNGPIPFVTPGDLGRYEPVKRSLTNAGAGESVTVRAGAALVCCIGATIGKMAKARERSAFNQQINAVEWTGEINDRYGLEVLRFFKPTIVAWGASTTLPILKKSTFEKIEVPVPPLPLQREFAYRIEAVEKLKTAHSASLMEMDALFESLQHRAFRGEL
jgi:type I restriction enzyme S subunit